MKSRLLLPNEGKPWNKDDYLKLVELYNKGEPMSKLELLFGRTKNALSTKLRRGEELVIGAYCIKNKSGGFQVLLSRNHN